MKTTLLIYFIQVVTHWVDSVIILHYILCTVLWKYKPDANWNICNCSIFSSTIICTLMVAFHHQLWLCKILWFVSAISAKWYIFVVSFSSSFFPNVSSVVISITPPTNKNRVLPDTHLSYFLVPLCSRFQIKFHKEHV